jgi:hypothetical protein
MYYRKETVKHGEGFNDQVTGPSAELVAVFRAYHNDNRIVKDTRKITDDFNATDCVIYKDKATMDAYDAEINALTGEGKTWGSGISFFSEAQGEISDLSDSAVSEFDWSKKSHFFE